MKPALTQSNFFAAAFFGIAVTWFGAYQAVRAAAGAVDWADIPALIMLAVLVDGLLAIALNYIWLQVLEKRGESTEEPNNFWPTKKVVERLALVALLACVLGSAQAYVLFKATGYRAPMGTVNCLLG